MPFVQLNFTNSGNWVQSPQSFSTMSSRQQTLNLDKSVISDKPNKIRKRGSSSSSSSSLVRKYRFKRAILVPMWNTRTKSPSMATQLAKPLSSSVISGKEKDLSVFGRKLAATLWEINDLPTSRAKKDIGEEKVRSKKKEMWKQKAADSSKPNMSDSSYSRICESERVKGFEGEGSRRVSTGSHKLQLADYYLGGFDDLSNANFNEVGDQPRNSAYSKDTVRVKNRLNKARTGLSTSKKLLKALNQICLHKHNSSSMPLILGLRRELDQVCNQIDQVIQEKGLKQNDVEHLLKNFAEAKAAWKRREREKVRHAMSRMAEEIEVEKRLRRQIERLNKKIAQEMADVKASHFKISEELETEKRARNTLEQICNELAKGIEEDRAEVEELKRESAKVRDEVEKEREMFQFANVLREERVQMKLLEARYEFEEKNAVLEKLRNELEAFLKNEGENSDVSPLMKKIKDLESYLNRSRWGSEPVEKQDDTDAGYGVKQGDESDDSDIRSIELSLDNNKSYKWSYACDDDGGEEFKGVSIDGIGRKSFFEKIQRGSSCFNKKDFGKNIQKNSNELEQEGSSGLLSGAQMLDKSDEFENFRSKSRPLQDGGGEAEISFLLEGGQLKQEAAGRISI
ncbi:uncharacterized protein LOC129316889 isoform X1 [Prosopis cineraria]|uniref:uncharacterized protein LOC129316889 isoform X1 n=1 Tax=Prosopis cineraria TaxID=364024 RepID=UPI00240F3D24|nr:uncharacterized protein LOC129316889 isoform X1 [Prosopis cineraria]